jgi:hypothetical protein
LEKETQDMTDHIDEIEAVVEEARRRGEFEALASLPADAEAAEIGALLAQTEELGDADVDMLLSAGPSAPAVPDDTIEQEVARAMDRDRRELEGRILEAVRNFRGLRTSDLVESLRSTFGIDVEKRDKLRAYYHDLEEGLLPPMDVNRRVYEALAEALEVRAMTLIPVGARPQSVHRYAPPLADEREREQPEDWDEVDELFRGGFEDLAS